MEKISLDLEKGNGLIPLVIQDYESKGATSGNFQEVKEIWADCDNDTLLIKVIQRRGACHTGNKSCFFRRIK